MDHKDNLIDWLKYRLIPSGVLPLWQLLHSLLEDFQDLVGELVL